MTPTPSQDCPQCGRFVQDRPNRGLHCECGWTLPRGRRQVDLDRQRLEEAVPPLYDHLDPDEFHAHCRERFRRTVEGQRSPLYHGAYGLEPGDRILWSHRLYRIDGVTRWPDGRGHRLALTREHDGQTGHGEIPWTGMSSWRVEYVPAGCQPVCDHCGDPWPCQQARQAVEAFWQADTIVKQFEHEQTHPHKCDCGRRFKTERGKKQHRERARVHRQASGGLL